jgi:uncharacterized protein
MTKESLMTNAETAGGWGSAHSLDTMIALFVIRLLTAAIRLYQLTLPPARTFLFGPAAGCRFTPSCSQYATEALREHGAIAGSWLAAKRIGRCHPLGDCGHDPIPRKEPGI